MLSPRLTNCKECANIPDLLRKIDCKVAELGNNLYNNVVFMLNRDIAVTEISQLLAYKRILQHRFCDTSYAEGCHDVTTEEIASKVIRLTAGCVPFCNEPTVCEITTCAITPCPNPTTTTTSTSSTSTTSTTSTSSTTTSTTTINCNFTGVIDCSITTTTTTTPPPTTTTTTTYFPDPFGIPCLWSTNGGDAGLVGVYDFDTNTATDVLVPNDFNTTVGIERPICATEDKLWLASVVDQGSNLDNDVDDKVYIREWDIDGTTPNAPTLTYVREITVRTGQYSGANLGGSSVWAMTAKDNDTLILGMGNEYAPAPQEGTGGTGSLYGLEFSIAAAGDITVNNSDISSEWIASAGNNTGKISNLTYTNSGQLILGYRLDLMPDGSGLAHVVGNYIKVFPTTPADPNFSINNIVIQTQRLQENGYPEFTNTYTGVKDAPFWGVNGLAQLLHPETLEVYNMAQVPQQVFPGGYQLSLTTNVVTANDWLSSATGCSNIEFEIADFPNCGLTYFPALVVDGNYLGPQTFEYFGMTCTATLAENINAFQYSGATTGGFLGCSGLIRPSSEGEVISRIVQGNNFSITIEFPVPVNDIPVRASVLNSNEDGTGGDVYYVETNGGTPTLSINQGCFAQVDGNRLWGGVANPPIETAYNNEGDGEFKVTAPTSYTSMTIYGNAPTGGHLFLGCPPVSLNCNRIFTGRSSIKCSEQAGICAPENTSGNYLRVYSQNITTNIVEEVVLPAGSYFTLPNSDLTDNYYIGQINQNFSSGLTSRWTRYEYSSSPSGVPSNVVWEEVLYEINPSDLPDRQSTLAGISTINDNTFVVGYWKTNSFQVVEVQIVEGSTTMDATLKLDIPFPFYGFGEFVVTLKEDGTGNKFIGFQQSGFNDDGIIIQQFDYDTGNLELTIEGPALNWRSGGDMTVIDNELFATLVDNTPSNDGGVGTKLWKINLQTHVWEQLPDTTPSAHGGGGGSLPSCRTNNGFTPLGTTTTTTTDPNTTTTTTTSVPGVRTIFTKFNLFNQSV